MDLYLTHDVEGAGQLLSDAGYPHGRGFPSVELHIAGSYSPVGDVLSAEWRATVGVEARSGAWQTRSRLSS